ncbi:hypothetical protein [Aurantiacibacter aquimixticola]|uniref:Uncharacterized protein n=1 Tax=Aurantiacibacter aquimixticola TaxID=1958945 RepID=A0A419RQZ4_9SPHN|nr:hypothetical protein [Aurantiacibacter aquimixticola]RJY08187.1 hypothetical protein D6201_01385 [Aurantiacibacter aquimixticola]
MLAAGFGGTFLDNSGTHVKRDFQFEPIDGLELATNGLVSQGSAVGRGGELPPVGRRGANGDVTIVDLVHTSTEDDFFYAKPDGADKPGKGGGGGGGGGFTPDAYTSGPADASADFNITIVFEGTWTQSLYDIFVAAADFYTALIAGNSTLPMPAISKLPACSTISCCTKWAMRSASARSGIALA